jgi:BMFP domain-containing protein YqiC
VYIVDSCEKVMRKVLAPISSVIKNSKSNIVKKSINKLDVVSREEFETQKKILLKTRKKLEELELELDKLLRDKS